MCRVIFGKQFEYNDVLFQHSAKNFLNDPWKAMMFNLAVLLPFTKILPPVKSVLDESLKQQEDSFSQFKKEISRIQSEMKASKFENFIEAFLIEQKRFGEFGENEFFTEKQLLIYIRDLFGAGCETSSSTLLCCFLTFLHYPSCQDKIQSQIRDIIGIQTPSMEHRDFMPYTQAFVEEIFRYCTLAPIGIPRCSPTDVEINGFIVRKDVKVIFNIWGAHNDSNIFEKPEEFRPERFLNDEGMFVRSKYVFAFSLGRRNCLGEQLARMEIYLFVVSILQKLSVRHNSSYLNKLPALDDGVLGIAYVPKPFTLTFVKTN
ncbi:cytochrome P450 2C70-like [Styela clava]